MTGVESRTVDWWSVHQFVIPLLEEVKSWPVAGTLTWINLPESDPTKVAALYDAAQHWALRVDTCQEAIADASKAISQAADWAGFRTRSGVYIPRSKEVA